MNACKSLCNLNALLATMFCMFYPIDVPQSAVRESAERADALQNRLDQRRKQMEEATKATEEQRQALSLENQRLAFDIEALKQKEVRSW